MKRILSTIFFGLISLVSGPVQAQFHSQSDVAINSIPEGAKVTLKGEVLVSGLTPVRFRQLMIGEYKVKLTRFGYEDYTTQVVIDPTRPLELNIKMTPKTRLKAAIRSMAFPGWGQRYSGQKNKSWLMASLSAVSVLAFFATDVRLGDKEDVFFETRARFNKEKTFSGRQRLLPLLDQAQEEAFDAENNRRIAIIAVAGIWGLNVLDALFLFPARRSNLTVKGVIVAPSANSDRVGVSLSRKF